MFDGLVGLCHISNVSDYIVKNLANFFVKNKNYDFLIIEKKANQIQLETLERNIQIKLDDFNTKFSNTFTLFDNKLKTIQALNNSDGKSFDLDSFLSIIFSKFLLSFIFIILGIKNSISFMITWKSYQRLNLLQMSQVLLHSHNHNSLSSQPILVLVLSPFVSLSVSFLALSRF